MKKLLFSALLLLGIVLTFSSCYRTDWSCSCYTISHDTLTNRRYWDLGKIQASKAGDICRSHKDVAADTCYVEVYK